MIFLKILIHYYIVNKDINKYPCMINFLSILLCSEVMGRLVEKCYMKPVSRRLGSELPMQCQWWRPVNQRMRARREVSSKIKTGLHNSKYICIESGRTSITGRFSQMRNPRGHYWRICTFQSNKGPSFLLNPIPIIGPSGAGRSVIHRE